MTSLPFAIVVAIGLLVGGSACFAATVDSADHWIGVIATGAAVGLSSVYVGTVARKAHRSRRRRR